MIITKITRQNATEVRLIEDDNVVKTLTTDRANDPFGIWILPRRTRCGQDFLNSHRSDTILEDHTVRKREDRRLPKFEFVLDLKTATALDLKVPSVCRVFDSIDP